MLLKEQHRMVNTSRMLYLKVRSQHKNVSFYVNQERISKRVHLISNISTHKLFFLYMVPGSPSNNVASHVAWKFFVEDENARNAAWAVDIKNPPNEVGYV